MLCEKCKKNNATVHYRYTENGVTTEFHYCSECAKNEGLMNGNGSATAGFMSQNGIYDDYFVKTPLSSLFGNVFAGKPQGIKTKVCPGCGLSESEFRSGGKLGCEQCYETFFDIVAVMLGRMHQSTEYKGKMPEGIGEKISLTAKIDKLKTEMQEAVERQEYEEAAKLRDAIKQLEEAGESGSENRGDVI